MSDLTKYPMVDDYETTLAQERTGGTWTVYVNAVPSFTFPSGVSTYLVVNPGKSNMQVAVVDSYDSANKTRNVTSISVNKWAGTAYTQQTHWVWSIVKISNNYQFWEDLNTAITSKLDSDGGNWSSYASTAARDAALWGDWAATKDYRMIKAWSAYYNYNLSTAQREIVDTGTATPDATTSSSGIGELPTQSESDWGSTTWSAWPLLSTPQTTGRSVQKNAWTYWASTTWNDTYVVTLSPVPTAYTVWMPVQLDPDTANTGACTINVNSLGAKAIKTRDWNDPESWDIAADEIVLLIYDWVDFILQKSVTATTSRDWLAKKATDAKAAARTDTDDFVTSNQLIKIATGNWSRVWGTATGTVNIPHWLWRTPLFIRFTYATSTWWANQMWSWMYDWTNTLSVFDIFASNTTYVMFNALTWNFQVATVTFDATNIVLSRTKWGTWGDTIEYIWEARW